LILLYLTFVYSLSQKAAEAAYHNDNKVEQQKQKSTYVNNDIQESKNPRNLTTAYFNGYTAVSL